MKRIHLLNSLRFNLDSLISKFLSWVIALSVFSYPITAVLILQLGLPGSVTNFALRVLFASMYVLLLFFGVLKGGKRWSLYLLPVLLFFLLYSIRLVWDISFVGVQISGYSNFYVYSYYFGLTLLPCVAMIIAQRFLNVPHLLKLSSVLLIVANVLLVYQMLTQGSGLNIVEVLATRAQVRSEEEGRTFINPIVVGFFGANLSLLSIGVLILNISESKLDKIFYFFSIPLGIISLLFGASRGPLFGFILTLVFLLAYYYLHVKKTVSFLVKMAITCFLGGITVWKFVLPFVNKNDIFLLDRVESFINGTGTVKKEARHYSFEGALNDFIDSPIIGRQYVGTYDNFYPHNIPLEVLMATGIVGFSVFTGITLVYAKSIYRAFFCSKRRMEFIIILLSLVSFLAGMTSGSIFFTPNFWIFIVLASILIKRDYYNESSYTH